MVHPNAIFTLAEKKEEDWNRQQEGREDGDSTYLNTTIIIAVLLCRFTKLMPHFEKDKVYYREDVRRLARTTIEVCY